jgi:hypothetical protein
MATVAPAPMRRRINGERLFYAGMAWTMLLAVLIGFGPTYYWLPVTGGGRPITPLTHLHGLVFSAWMMLFVAQASLVAAGNVRLHMRLGLIGMGLVAVMVIVALLTALSAAARGSAPPGMDPLSWLAIPLLDIPVFAGLFFAALANRRRPQVHKRLMLIGMIGMMSPAFGRMPWPEAIIGPITMFGIPDLFLLALITWDIASTRRVHGATIIGGAVLIASQLFRVAIWQTDWWLAFAGWSSAFMR